ncbi:unnamed protein product [Linum tenue]|uniref:Uncharacterized protein n=1 Tax=Linum tenue TaxID=586396 RepID=A0AAV0I7H0_9ROSI|nr:unnamed protein product [Linum tenue]
MSYRLLGRKEFRRLFCRQTRPRLCHLSIQRHHTIHNIPMWLRSDGGSSEIGRSSFSMSFERRTWSLTT